MKSPYLFPLIILSILFGCAPRDTSTPLKALIGHWSNQPARANFYFSSDLIFSDQSPTGFISSGPYTVEKDDPDKRNIIIKISERDFKLPDGYEKCSVYFDLTFSPDFSTFSGSAYAIRGVSWDLEFEEKTEMSKIYFDYVDGEEKPPEK